MPIEIVRNDITRMHTDAIVNAANQTLLGGGGVDGAIHRAAGPGLLEECRELNGCETGMAKITGGYNLPAKHVIHTVGPVWHGGGYSEADLLAACYRNSLMLAARHGCESVAFPLISAGAYGYPKDQALKIALDTIRDYLLENDDMMVYLVLFDKTASALGSKLYAGVRKYIDDHYVDLHSDTRSIMRMRYKAACAMPRLMAQHDMNVLEDCSVGSMPSLEDALSQLDESFSQMVLRRIDEKGISDSACYKKANIDRKLFSKIRSDVHYKPSKRTALALAIALELNLADTRDLLMKAGFALSRSNKFDIIIEYFIVNGRYDIHEINETLFFFDQALLGG